ncbi:MAG TPA: sulfite exporter TauE/SafE family protein [Nocardioidaceae bacterium]
MGGLLYPRAVLVAWLVVLVVFLGALTRVTFGFGEAVVAMPLLALLPIGLHTAASLMGLVGLILAATSMVGGFRDVDRGVLVRLLAGTAVGVPVGLVLVLLVPEQVVSVLLGLFLVVYGAYGLSPHGFTGRVGQRWAPPVGVVAGGLGSAYSFHGIPVAVYGTLRGWSPEVFRGTLQAFFLVSGVLVVTGQALGGLWSQELLVLVGVSLPAIAVAMLIGRALHGQMPAHRFQRYVHLLVVVLGFLLVGKVVLQS